MRLIPSDSEDFDSVCQNFQWQVPEFYNIAQAVCDKHLDIKDQIALYYENASGLTRTYTFGDIQRLSNRLANAFSGLGIKAGDRIAIVLPQRVETALAHLAAYKLGAIALPLSVLFGQDALTYRLQDSGAKCVVADSNHTGLIQSLRSELPELSQILDCDTTSTGGFWPLLEKGSDRFTVVKTRADDPALLIYTSGTTGPAKGAVIAHRAMIGNQTGFELSHNLFPQENDLFWTPADWAWTGGLWDALLPTWFYGKPMLAYDGGKFDPERACHLIKSYQVKNAFIPPTALKMMRQADNIGEIRGAFRSIMSAGETVGAELFEWGKEALDLEINEMWGQTEFNYLVGNCADIMPIKPGSLGKAYAGHRVDVIDESGNPMPTGEVGELAAMRGDPVMFLGYWKKEAATREKFIGDWYCTGDVGYRDEDGYLWFVGRKDDVITSSGYRIGPGEIEDVLLKHPAVMQAAAIGSPDEMRGDIIKAFIVLAPGSNPSEALKAEIKESVRHRLAAYEYPREIEFIEQMPMTTTGKVRRIELRNREIENKSFK